MLAVGRPAFGTSRWPQSQHAGDRLKGPTGRIRGKSYGTAGLDQTVERLLFRPMTVSARFRFHVDGIAHLLSDRTLAVPVYQRPYAWQEDQVRQFWEDLEAALAREAAEYFLGTLVISADGELGRDNVIDGQQRLATTTLLLAALRDAYRSRGDSRRAQILQRRFLVEEDLDSGEEETRLRLNDQDDPFFRNRVVEDVASEPATESNRKLLAAYRFLAQRVEQDVASYGDEWASRIRAWVEFLADRVLVVAAEVPTEVDAFLIFETLNDRGADLTISDLLKNYLLRLSGGASTSVEANWTAALAELDITVENELFVTFLRHYWSSRVGAVRERDLYGSIREAVASEDETIAFAAQLPESSRLYAAMLDSDHERWMSSDWPVRASVSTLTRFELVQFRPLLLAVLELFSSVEQQRTLRALISWSTRGLLVGGIGGGTFENAYCRAAVRVRAGELTTADELYRQLLPIIPADDAFRRGFTDARVRRPLLARYFLLALQRAADGVPLPEVIDEPAIGPFRVEPILPRTPADDDWAEFDRDEWSGWVFRLGNLALLEREHSYPRRGTFAEKLAALETSTVGLSSHVGAMAATWTPGAVYERQGALAQAAVDVWARAPRD